MGCLIPPTCIWHPLIFSPSLVPPFHCRIDAPCSSDRHVLQQSALARGVIPTTLWSSRGCKKAADLQLQLLLAGLRCGWQGLRGDDMQHITISAI